MTRLSKRVLLRALEAAQIDVKAKGPNVSDDVQLTYVLDDIGEQLVGHGAVGDFTAAKAGLVHALQAEVRTRRGLFIQEVIGLKINTPIQIVAIGTSDTGLVFDTPFVEPIGIQEGVVPLQTVWTSGYVPFSVFSAAIGFYRAPLGEPLANLMQGLFVGFGRFFQMISSDVAAPGEWSVRWKELH